MIAFVLIPAPGAGLFFCKARMTPDTKDASTWPRRMVVLGLTTAVINSSAPIPLYPIYRTALGLDTFTMTLIFVVYVVAVLTSLLGVGRLLPLIGNPHRVFVPAVAAVACGALIMTQADSLHWLLLGRVLAGLGTGSATVAANAALVDLTPGRDLRHAALLSTLSFGAGSAIGPVLSGIALQLGWWPTVLPFLLIAVSALTAMRTSLRHWNVQPADAAALAAGARNTELPAEDEGPSSIRWFAFTLCAATILVTWGFGAIMMALGPYFGEVLLGVTDYAVSGYATAVFTLFGMASQWLHRRQPLRGSFLRGCMLIAPGLACLCVAMLLSSPSLAALSLVVISTGHGAAFGAAAGIVNHLAPASQRSRLVSLFYVAGYVGNLLPMLLGRVTDHFGAAVAAIGFLAFACLAIIGIGLGARRSFVRL